MVKRDVTGRYRGSMLGILWSFFLPVFMLGVYTFVFSVVFKARWQAGSDSKTEFALVLFAGLLVFNLFAECVTKAPGLILSNANYVKKVVFPLEILPVVALGAALFHMLVSLVVWAVFYLALFGKVPSTAIALPLVLLPLILLSLGLSWFLAAIGVYLRDIAQITGVVVSTLMFLSPIFFPLSALPESYQPLLLLNPLTPAIEMSREVLVWGHWPNWALLGQYLLLASLIAYLGFAWFQKTRKGFADVL
ncbi:ABC transporter permease [Zoogloea sp.]|uniref:ABC transporter permease n=1 Tax=Zoogloea sp. TaxID=49181 RepID=UPI00261C4882|nr:ABC transporter permease [Zoogloea sp.]MDD3354505.1 ABC transporter permease [Zoogloea sp.]